MLMLILYGLIASLHTHHFNTSHVNVNRRYVCNTELSGKISIHLMLMLIQMQLFTEAAAGYFNTSHVNVNRFKTCNMGR